jgi:hypothetical protein
VDLGAALRRLGGKQAVYLRMLRNFIVDLATLPTRLRTDAAQGRMLPVAQLLHTLKGLAATLGVTALAKQAARAEELMGAATTAGQALQAMAEVCAAIAAAGPGLAQVQRELEAVPAPDPADMPVLDRAEFQAALHALAEQLRQADMAATDAMEALQRHFGGALGEALHPLDDAIGALDFELALQLCLRLSRTAAAQDDDSPVLVP